MSITDMFSGMTHYPGSKTKRTAPAVAETAPEIQSWDSRPYLKLVNGKEMELFTVGALAMALNKSVDTIRLWERKGYIPAAPYRLRTEGGGRRLYSRALIEATIDEFAKRDLFRSRRVDWDAHEDLPIALLERWRRVKAAEAGRQDNPNPATD